jgi:hypothetical protein
MQSFLKLFSSTRGSDGSLSETAGRLSNDDMSMAASGRLGKGSLSAGVGVGVGVGGTTGGGDSESAARLRSLNPFTEAQVRLRPSPEFSPSSFTHSVFPYVSVKF